jgi:hypothetical protein
MPSLPSLRNNPASIHIENTLISQNMAKLDRSETIHRSPALSWKKIARNELARGTSTDHDIRARVHELLLAMYPPGPPMERRVDRRYPYPRLIRLTPVAEDGCTPMGTALVVVGHNLSERGMGFFHQAVIPYRRVIASFDAGDDRWLGLLVDLTWCRFTKLGWYECGGRFVQAVSALPPTPGPLAQ